MTWSLVSAWLTAHGLELAGVVTTIVGIWLTTKRLLICWPIILLADFLYLVVFFQSGFFSDALLQVFFVVFTIYGWWHWWRGIRVEGEVRVVPLGVRACIVALVVGALGSLLLEPVMIWLGGILHKTVALPHLDAMLASYSLVATWWGARKHIANWWLWIVVDLVYIGEYIYKDLWPTAMLYAGLVGLAVLGMRDWRRAAETSPVPNP
ncbi:MAG: nicotinamide riboside transporter PnuC [Terracidiphilus sp.]|jgi:nicotinamide mononucleotide transporter